MAKTKADYMAQGRALYAARKQPPLEPVFGKQSWQDAAICAGYKEAATEVKVKTQARREKTAKNFGVVRRVYRDAERRANAILKRIAHKKRMNALTVFEKRERPTRVSLIRSGYIRESDY